MTDWSTARRSCSETWTSSRRPTSSCRTSSKSCGMRSGERPKERRATETNQSSGSNDVLCPPGVRTPQPRSSTPCMTTTTTTTTSAPTGRRISARRRGINAPRVRRTSCPPSPCRVHIDLLHVHQPQTRVCHVLHESKYPQCNTSHSASVLLSTRVRNFMQYYLNRYRIR